MLDEVVPVGPHPAEHGEDEHGVGPLVLHHHLVHVPVAAQPRVIAPELDLHDLSQALHVSQLALGYLRRAGLLADDDARY